MNQKRILYEDQDIIVCHKAAGIATQTARVGQADMVSEIANYLSRAGKNAVRSLHGSRGMQPYVGVIHRLDQPVEGVLVLAKHKKAAAMLSRQIAEDETEKYYYAIVCGQGYEKQGDLE
ncbi:MAG: RluA family pseudouridine synthase, partial [Lachnospiraceae bacterium]|nr:RluA family pseudouridine synthase [Lachnospiraceae bacterium]